VQRILHGNGVPPFCKHAGEVMERTLDLDGSSIELARTVLKDLGLTSQVLRAANSAFYNRSGRPIMSVAHALILLGWDKVRSLVSTIRFVEHFADRAPGLRELMLLSVLSAVESREIAAAIGYPRPEEAYICGLFKNIGEVLVACEYPREYSQIVLAMHTEKIPVHSACLRVLDFSWDEVASEVAAAWNMPAKVQKSLSGPDAAHCRAPVACLAGIADYSRDLTRALYRDCGRSLTPRAHRC
jgi:HD-like signal output (HDOD) protein